MGLDAAWTGQHFQQRLHNLPLDWMLHYIFMLARRLAPSMRVGDPAAPYVLSPLVSTAQARSAHSPCHAPACMQGKSYVEGVTEECSK